MEQEQTKEPVSRFTSKYLSFVGMFVGAGFISGSIVHLGEGINPWDVTVLIVGVLFFLAGTCVQEFVFNKKSLNESGVALFILYSIVLSIAVGMASGGIQHFVDTPTYSSYLVPIGLGLGVIAFFLKENHRLSAFGWVQFLSVIAVSTVVLIWLLGVASEKIPETLLQGQGAHDHGAHGH